MTPSDTGYSRAAQGAAVAAAGQDHRQTQRREFSKRIQPVERAAAGGWRIGSDAPVSEYRRLGNRQQATGPTRHSQGHRVRCPQFKLRLLRVVVFNAWKNRA